MTRLVFETMDFAVQVQSISLCLLVMSDDGVATFPLPNPGEVVVGRGADCDVRLEGFGVSRRHVALRIGPTLELVDLGSRNGTLLGDRRLVPNEPVVFSVGDTARIGDTLLMLQATTARAAVRFSSRPAFEARVDREIKSAQKNRTKLALLWVAVAPDVRRTAGEQGVAATASPDRLVGEALRPVDLLFANGSREFEILLVDVTPASVEAASAGIQQTLADNGLTGTLSVALFPKDGATRELLEHTATARLRAVQDAPAPAVDSSALKKMVPILERVAGGMINVLILGETGVGKEVLAHAIHAMSPRAKAKIVCLNCCALTDTLHESELFGHERGAFTGAVRDKAGLLETANGGTVFLDEVAEMPLPLQAKFLRVLEQKEVTRVGAVQPHPIDVRILAATNRDLEADVEAGRFRRDLYFRLNGVTVVVPPLRERVDEIESLARGFIEGASRLSGSRAPSMSPEVLAVFKSYSWPGNIRELRNLIDRAVLLCTGGVIQLEHLPMDKLAPHLTGASAGPTSGPVSHRTLPPPPSIDGGRETSVEGVVPSRDHERARIIEALRTCRGNQTKAAELLNMSRRTLVTRITEFGLPRPRKHTQ